VLASMVQKGKSDQYRVGLFVVDWCGFLGLFVCVGGGGRQRPCGGGFWGEARTSNDLGASCRKRMLNDHKTRRGGKKRGDTASVTPKRAWVNKSERLYQQKIRKKFTREGKGARNRATPPLIQKKEIVGCKKRREPRNKSTAKLGSSNAKIFWRY